MKKRLVLWLVVILSAGMLAGCGDADSGSDETREERQEREDRDRDRDRDKKDKESGSEAKKETSEETESVPEPSEAEPEATPAGEPEQDAEPAGEKPSVAMPTELSDELFSFQISVNGDVYQFPMWYSDFEALGWTYCDDIDLRLMANEYSICIWEKDGVRASTRLANLTINGADYTDCIVASVDFDPYYMKDADWEIILPGGIQYGVSNAEDIRAAYGEPDSDYDGTNYYKMEYTYDYYQSVELYVYKDTDTLRQIEVENMIELEGGDNSVSDRVPAIVGEYSAPSALGDDLYDFNFELDGRLYVLPCPVQVLLDNGFTLNENKSAEYIAADSTGWVEFTYNGEKFRTLAENFADYATIPQNCFVTEIETSEHGPVFDLVIPGGIRRGSTEEELVAAIGDKNCEKKDSGDYTYYTVYDPDGSLMDNVEITVSGGVVIAIEMSNDDM